MSVLTQEIDVMQNPALGAVLLWRFTKAYVDAHPQKSGPVLPLVFLVLPLVWHQPTAELITGTKTASGLRTYAAKFADSTEGGRDILLLLHDRTVRWREKSAASLRMAYAGRLLTLDSDGRLYLASNPPEPTQNRTVATMIDGVEKLGVWVAPLSLEEIGLTLHVRF